MRVLIVEDESAAAQNLRSILRSIEPPLEVVAICESVVECVDFLQHRASQIDLIFMDIHLADGDAFKIFERVEVSTPIIFTTAYDQYALKAFKVNSVDYLLKPINSAEVSRALEKLQQLSSVEVLQYTDRVREVAREQVEYVRSFLVHVKDKIIPVGVDDIAYIYTSNDRVMIYLNGGESYLIDKRLDTLISQLDPAEFFRANRQFIISRSAVRDVSVWFGSRLSVNLIRETPEKIIVPKAKIHEFKEWLSLRRV